MNIFITGATAGFGLAMTQNFIKLGHRVIAVGRRLDRLQKLKAEHGDKIFILNLDVTQNDQLKKAINELPDEWKKIDVLINNAGLAIGTEMAHKSSLEDWNTMVNTNIVGLLNCTHAILPEMVKNNSGHIVNLGSVAGEFPYPGGNVYGATKAFVHQFSLNLKADLLGTKVRVTNVEPGMCLSEFSEVRFNGDKDKAASVYQGMQPLSSEDIADTINWIITRPNHININVISLMPTDQAFSGFAINRKN
jgi:3-hydroxy acid dehydrogenase/malonic semialdehyde reductase